MRFLRKAGPPLSSLAPRRICLIKPSALGDIVQTLPVLAMLRRRWPDAHISWVVRRALAGLLEGHPEIDELLIFERAGRDATGASRSLWAGLSGFGALLRQLRAARFDLVVDLQGLARSGLMTLATGAARRVGMACAREGAGLCYTDVARSATFARPAWERYVNVARELGCGGPIPAATIPITPAHRGAAARRLAELPRPILAICPGAQWETKRWPPRHFAALARRAAREFGTSLLLLGARNERGWCDEIAGSHQGPLLNLAGETELLELAALCEAVDLFVSGDTGPMHLAAALGTPTASLFTCTDPVESGPRPQGAEDFAAARPDGSAALPTSEVHFPTATTVPCAASYLARCASLACMDELQPARVWPALVQAFAASQRRRAA